MAIPKEVLDELLKDYKGPDDITGPDGLLKHLTKALVERAMDAEMTTHLGYEKHDQAEKDTRNRRNGKTSRHLRSDQGRWKSRCAGSGRRVQTNDRAQASARLQGL